MPKKACLAGERFLTPQTLSGMPPDTPVLLAFSGGADSRALLHLLAKQAQKDGFALTAAHVNHGIRGDEALRDREFCREIAFGYGIECCVLDVDIPSLAKAHGTGLEEEARQVRYEWFERLMRERNIPLLATAHHADDNMETVLFRICRGTGTKGLCGIAPARPFAGGYLTRPLLRMTRREILTYCEQNGLEYVTDSTNADTAYARNRIRCQVIPALESLFENPQRRALSMTEALREDEELLTSLADKFLREHSTQRGISLEALRQAPRPIARRALAKWFNRETGRELERVHTEALFRLLAEETPRAEVALPGDRIAVAEMGSLRLLPREKDDLSTFSTPLILGETLLPSLGMRISVEKIEDLTKINNLSTQTCINLYLISDIMKSGLYWRTRRSGDVILRGGMHRKLRRLYREADVPPALRERMPLLCDGEGIVWAPYVGCRDGLPAKGTAYILRVEPLLP